MEYVNWLFNNIESISEAIGIIINCIEGVILIVGISFIKTFKEKKNIATFTFWSQLSDRLRVIASYLEHEKGLINNLYENNNEWEEELTPDIERINEFKEHVINTLKFIDNAVDQIPAYSGWTNDYDIIKEFLSDVKIYDICNSEKYFKYCNNETKQNRDKNIDKVIEAINHMCLKIKKEQMRIEKRIS